jgi:predicted ATPase with chaperone activity
MGMGEVRGGAAVAEGVVIEGLGIRRSLVEALVLKSLYFLGEASLHELAQQLCITRAVVENVFQKLRKEQLCQAVGMSVGMHHVTLTQAGRTRAGELLAVDSYVGPVPVALTDYVARVRSQSVRDIEVTPDEMAAAFEGLVLDPGTLGMLGTGVVSGRVLFLYGPAGTGKTSVAERLSELFRRDSVLVPYAVEVDGQIITVYDSHVHERVDDDASSLGDARWVRCRRPRVMVGGELTIEMLDLQFNPLSRFYTAPVQMRANNGFLIVDDFGRQRIPPAELLNRWVVPLDRRIDFLTLAGGKKLEIPFDLFVVFATNLDPALVVEEAFLRRIQTKIRLGAVSPAQFHEIFRRACESLGLTYDEGHVETVLQTIEGRYRQPLRACYPRDLLHQIVWRARYEQREAVLDAAALERACQAYFLERDTPAKG